MLVKKCSKSSKTGFNNTWTVNFQMFKLVLENAEEPDQIANILWIIEKAGEFQKDIYWLYWLCQEKAMATHSSTLACKIPWTEEPGGLQSTALVCNESDTTERLHFHFSLSCIGEGNGNPLQCSCLENPGLLSMGSHRVRHDWSALAAAAAIRVKDLLFHIKVV